MTPCLQDIILEGLLTVVVAVAAFFILFDFPETASFLSQEERAFVAYRLKYDGQDESTEINMRIPQTESRDRKFIKEAFCDWQIWNTILCNWGLVIAGHILQTLTTHSHSRRLFHYTESP